MPVRYSSFLNFYPRPPRGGRLKIMPQAGQRIAISIHALREEGDVRAVLCRQCNMNFYPRPPRGGRRGHLSRDVRLRENFYPRPPRGGRRVRESLEIAAFQFLSTPSARRATLSESHCSSFRQYFYPRPPRGGRLKHHNHVVHLRHISIHALREEGDSCAPHRPAYQNYFYPRPPRGGRHLSTFAATQLRQISIHALREEGDLRHHHSLRISANFYPRPPRGGRHEFEDQLDSIAEFLSTPSARRATMQCAWLPSGQRISIHALREEGDVFSCCTNFLSDNFYPRPPRGGRHVRVDKDKLDAMQFLSTPSARRAT